MNTNLLSIYIILSVLVGYLAKEKGHGFLFYFVLSALFSPVIGIVLLMSAP